MKNKLLKFFVAIAIVMIASLCALPFTYAESTSAQEQTRLFIETVLPVDLSKYYINFTHQSSLELPNGEVQGTVRYNLESEENTIRVSFNIQNDIVACCHVYPMNGPVISDRHYANVLDAVKSFLEKYQTYSKLDSTKLIAMLDNVDITKNTTTITNTTKLSVINSLTGDSLTSFKWAYTANGVDYTSLQVSFQKDGTFSSFRDDRAICTIGDTSINISETQAIDIALKNLPSYSYNMPDHTVVSDFNVTEDKITAKLAASPVRSNEFRPYWNVRMPLNQTYPGSVRGIAVFIWANTGEIISISNIAFGGADYPDTSNPEETSPEQDSLAVSETTPSPTATESASPSSTENHDPMPSTEKNSLTVDWKFALVISFAIVAVLVTTVVAAKKRK